MNWEIGSEYGSPSVNSSKFSWTLDEFDVKVNEAPNTQTGSENNNSNNEKSNKTYYMVQITTKTKKLDTKPSNFKGLKQISVEKDKKVYKYFYGEETDLVACKKKLEEAKKKGYTSAYIVTFTK